MYICTSYCPTCGVLTMSLAVSVFRSPLMKKGYGSCQSSFWSTSDPQNYQPLSPNLPPLPHCSGLPAWPTASSWWLVELPSVFCAWKTLKWVHLNKQDWHLCHPKYHIAHDHWNQNCMHLPSAPDYCTVTNADVHICYTCISYYGIHTTPNFFPSTFCTFRPE